jgi:predicted RNA-binding Zn ribbon-like protein
MSYPLERAAELRAKIADGRVEPAVNEAFGRFVEAYSALYQYLDRVRTTAGEPRRAKRVEELLADVAGAAAQVRAALGDSARS